MGSKLNKYIIILGTILTLIIFLFIYLKYLDLNYEIMFKPIKDKNSISAQLADYNYNPNYPWEFKTLFIDIQEHDIIRDNVDTLNDELNKMLTNEEGDGFFTIVPYDNKNKERFKLKMLSKSEIGKLEKELTEGDLKVWELDGLRDQEIKDKYPSVSELANALFIKKNSDGLTEFGVFKWIAIGAQKVFRVTYILNIKLDIWVPCFVTYSVYDYLTLPYISVTDGMPYSFYTIRFLHGAKSNNFTTKWTEKETGNTTDITLNLKLDKEPTVPVMFENGTEFVTTEDEKEMAKIAFAKYNGNKTVWDENPYAYKYKELVSQKGKTYVKLKIYKPKFSYIENNK